MAKWSEHGQAEAELQRGLSKSLVVICQLLIVVAQGLIVFCGRLQAGSLRNSRLEICATWEAATRTIKSRIMIRSKKKGHAPIK